MKPADTWCATAPPRMQPRASPCPDLVDLHAGPGLHQLSTARGTRARCPRRGDVAEYDAGLDNPGCCGSHWRRSSFEGGMIMDCPFELSEPATSAVASRACHAYAASNTGAASVDVICSVLAPVLEKPCLCPARHDDQLTGRGVTRLFADPDFGLASRNVQHLLDRMQMGRGTMAGVHHCSNRPELRRAIGADTRIRVRTPGAILAQLLFTIDDMHGGSAAPNAGFL